MATLKYGLNIAKKPSGGPSRPKTPLKKPVFGDDDSEPETYAPASNGAAEISRFDEDAPSKPSEQINGTIKPVLKPNSKAKDLGPSQYGDLSTLQSQKKHQQEAEALDPSIYDYDAAYDALHAKDAARKAAARADAAERKPKYMESLLASAEVRKRDQLRAKEKLLQREREAEGDEFADKEKFVTSAYKQQQEEIRRMEEEEKIREEEEAKKKRSMGMQGFYKKIMEEEEKRHQEAMELAAQARPAGKQAAEDVEKEKSDLELARELNAKGRNVFINDEGEVADKRQLLSAGLNIAPKPKSAAVTNSSSSKDTASKQTYQYDVASRRAQAERQGRMMETQMAQAVKRKADEEAEKQRQIEQASKSRKTEADISSAKERYLARKREAAAAAAAAKSPE
ncbi:hypothetical protein W97_03582 [Coniosporium apollinis CBS 100218]|uniref:Nuclear speckle splicing regulatory protein 1 N-terminal domain-containing protein n=1 Tax=Coniosporium apollinis (strain CBS 100218) TaxID=1168221 RepID=R7YRQ6_CONA1|nr:uncharacterized protein W97_03582 [Coniosporium apollinis CBS 100218]EON64351.1 hypothetical protein W97_03582 [Coniosporium apollinis CBS 100218]